MAFNIETGEYMSRESFIEFLRDSPEYGTVDIGTADKPKRVSCGEPWWNYPMSCKITADRIVMEPTSLTEEEERAAWEGTPLHGTYNRWHILKRDRVEPNMSATLVDIQILTDHLLYISGYEPAAVDHFMNWLAQLYQFPQYKLRTANFWYSRCNYVGKSMLIDLLKPVYGGEPLVTECEGSAVGGQFTSLLKDGILRLFNELPASLDKARFEVLKTLVSEKSRKSEDKGRDARIVKNTVNLILCTNHADALPMAMGDPRFNVFRCDEPRKTDSYYKELADWIAGPGPELLAGVLAQWKFPTDWNCTSGGRMAPQTTAAEMVQREARSPLVNFIEELITGQQAPFDKDIGRSNQLIEQLGTSYPANTRSMKITSQTLADALRKLGAVKIGSGTAAKDNAWCWRYQSDWLGVRLKEWKAYLDNNAGRPFTVPEVVSDE
ncbi:primase-helicase family protein [Pseudomonas umsongensis]|uniref:NrS-1 polymerase-like helicase domain-containing protein n=1 Tax=Pseudomonas umsongensis TaxID=198618 RepID=A0AAE7DCV9_9PSED|nr:primase-helicase family protein [Pseudomonas umsongensis]QJC78222.1 hypothetical protein HGP31_07830 [Pseudomonas umsongensis]